MGLEEEVKIGTSDPETEDVSIAKVYTNGNLHVKLSSDSNTQIIIITIKDVIEKHKTQLLELIDKYNKLKG